jgi:catecholate siderophore receptor
VPTNIGLPIANVPMQSFNLLSKYKLTDKIEFGGQGVYNSKRYTGTLASNNNGVTLSGYWRFDAFLEAKVTKNITFKLSATNLFNKLYYDAAYRSAAPFVFVAPGRAIMASMKVKY